MAKTTLTLTIMILGILILLGYMAAIGLIWPLVSLIVIVLVLSHVAMYILGARNNMHTVQIMLSKAQQDFMDNAKENLAIMQSMQRVQNEQSKGLLWQLDKERRLPDNGNFLMAGDIFSELDD